MPIFDPGAILGVQGEQAYTIAKSLRFRSSASAYLSRTPASAGNLTAWTWSGWVKRGYLGSNQTTLFYGGSSGTVYSNIAFSSDTLQFVNRPSGGLNAQLVTTQVFRDPSAWYHVVAVWDTNNATSSDRLRLYVNGSRITSLSTATYPASGTTSVTNTASDHEVGATVTAGAGNYLDGYLSEVNFIDGQALDPTYFGQTDTATGVWMPKAYTGSYGTNGFYLKFDDVGSTTTTNVGYGKDSSPNANRWQTNNLSSTAGVTYDSMVDTPTNYDNGGNGAGNYATFNPLLDWHTNGSNFTFSNGNLDISEPATTTHGSVASTIAMTTGKWYFEATATAVGAAQNTFAGITSTTSAAGYPGQTASSYSYGATGNKFNNNTSSAYGATFAANDIIGVAFDADNGKIWFSKNGTWQASGDPVAGTNAAFTGIAAGSYFFVVGDFATTQSSAFSGNFGQRAFNSTPPTGFKALCTQNLPTPTIGATSSTLANKYFDVSTWTGNGTTPRQVVSGLGFQPDFVWAKPRSAATNHVLYDVVRGVGSGKALSSSLTDAEGLAASSNQDATYGYLSSVNTDGFTATQGSSGFQYFNTNTTTYAAWLWKANGSGSSNTSGTITSTVSANVTAGFSVVTYTGTGANATVGHGLGVAPKMVIVKNRNGTFTWRVYHASLSNTQVLYLSATDAATTEATAWNSTTPTSTVFSVGTSSGTNGNTSTYVAYCFAEVAGYSKFGSYTGNGSADGPMIWTGMRSRYIMIKRSDSTGNWVVYDTARNTYNAVTLDLDPNLSNVEAATGSNGLDILSNGFKIRDTSLFWNASGGTYIYAAFAESPFNYARAR